MNDFESIMTEYRKVIDALYAEINTDIKKIALFTTLLEYIALSRANSFTGKRDGEEAQNERL